MTFWETLGIEPSGDITVIKRAYAARLKVTRPDDNAEAYQRLRQAYEFAQRHASFLRAREDTAAKHASEASVAKDAAGEQPDFHSDVADNPASSVIRNTDPSHDQRADLQSKNGQSSDSHEVNAARQQRHEPVEQTPPSRPRQSLLIHHRADVPVDEPVKPAFSPASLVQATLEILRQRGPEALLAGWPSLQQELYELPLAGRAVASSLFAQLVIEQDLPAGFAVNLAKHFEWQTDFRVEQALGAQRAHRLFTKLTLGMQTPSGVAAPPARPLLVRRPHTVIFSELVAKKPKWWLWIFSTLAGARLPGQFLSMAVDEQIKLGISNEARAAALAWLQRGMLVRIGLVIGVLVWCWRFDAPLFGQDEPSNLVLDVLPLAIVAFYFQTGLANLLQRRWTWPLLYAEQISCVLAVVAAALMLAQRDPELAASFWKDHISLWSTLIGVILVAAAIISPPPSRRDTAQLRLPIQFVLNFLLCRLIIAASVRDADELVLWAYTAGWLGINTLVFPPIRKWMAGIDSEVRWGSAGRSAGPLALCLAILLLFFPGFPSLLQEIARRTSQRLVFAAVAIALFLPSSQPIQATLTLLVLGIAAVLMLMNKLSRDYAFVVMTGTKRVDWAMVVLACFIVLGLSSLTWSLNHPNPVPRTLQASAESSMHNNPPLAISSTLSTVSEPGKSVFTAGGAKPAVLAPYLVTVTPEEALEVRRSRAPEQHLLVLMLQSQIADWIGPLTVVPGSLLRCKVEYGADGSIVSYSVLRGSANAKFDEAVRQAIYKAAPLRLTPNLDEKGEAIRRVDVQVVAR